MTPDHFETPFVERPRGLARRTIRTLAWLGRAKFTAGSLVFIRSDTDVYLVRERFRQSERWGFPGGFWKRNETAATAAVRELREEVGLQVDPLDLTSIDQYRQPWSAHIDHLFHLDLLQARPQITPTSVELLGGDWFPIDALPDLTTETAFAMGVLGRRGIA